MTNKELDKWLAENVMGWQERGDKYDVLCWYERNERKASAGSWDRWKPTESRSDAFQVVEKMLEKFPDWFFTLDIFGANYGPKYGDSEVVATFHESAEGYIIHSCEGAETAPLAICLAAKKAVEAGKGNG